MEKVITTEKIPIKLWLNDIEDGALEQAKNLANLPFAYKHIAIMPDSHQGYGMPIGGVLAAQSVVVPNAVGVDIGCGMCVKKTSLTEISRDDLKKIMQHIRETIPVGFKHHSEPQDTIYLPDIPPQSNLWELTVGKEYKKALTQVGTLGGGNHFIELQKGSDGYIWIMIHSGSRNVGFTVANEYRKYAEDFAELYYSCVPKDLAFFPEGTKEYWEYVEQHDWCVKFAEANRRMMLERVEEAFVNVCGQYIAFSNYLNKPHNFVAIENHFGKNVLVHRKGATRARMGEYGMIPGSQGTSSFIVRGKGNKDSFMSCSHGAGRTMSRTKARKSLSVESETALLNELGVLHGIRSEKDLDEAPSSYKDIQQVMNNQQDLVEVAVELKPLAVIKG